jgi:DNA-binding response OmpR family regulator
MTPTWDNPRDSLHQEIASLRDQLAERDEVIFALRRIISDTDTDFSVRWALSRFETVLLSMLMSGRLLSKEQLQDLSGEETKASSKNNIAVMMVRLRNKLARDGVIIETVWGLGYVIRKPMIARVRQLCSLAAKAA